jgi:hypothetical protein
MKEKRQRNWYLGEALECVINQNISILMTEMV